MKDKNFFIKLKENIEKDKFLTILLNKYIFIPSMAILMTLFFISSILRWLLIIGLGLIWVVYLFSLVIELIIIIIESI